jgi:hypothetical protein
MMGEMPERTPWVCPDCGRRFARRGQGHECAPAMSLEEYFATGPEHERPVFDAVIVHLEALGRVDVEPVAVGIFLKRAGRRFAQLRPLRRWVALSFSLPRVVTHPLILRRPIPHGHRYYHVVNLAAPGDLDHEIRAWLTEAYLDAE